MSSPITELVVKGSITVYLNQDSDQEILFQGSNNAIKQIKASVKNKTLTITKGYSLNDDRVIVHLTLKNLESIATTGDVRIETTTNIWLNKLSAKLSEESVATFYINSNLLNLDVCGKGDFNISGYIDTLKINGSEEAEILGNIKSIKLSCKTIDYSNITLEGVAFKSFLSAFNQSNIDLVDCENGNATVVSFDESKVMVTSLDVTEIYAFDKSSVHYRSENRAFIMRNTTDAQVKQETYKSIAGK